MSKKFLVPIDMSQLEVQNAALQNLATAPASPVLGQVYFNTVQNKALVWDGTNWVPWEANVNSVTGVKGNSESSYRTGDVNITAANVGAAPTSHASSSDTYGKGTSSNYGHVKLSDATDGTSAAASGGTAATPKAVKDALDAAKSYADGLDTGVSDVKVDGTSVVTSGVAAIDLTGKVDKETGKGLSTNDYTTDEKNKLAGIASGAEVNVQSDWNVTSSGSDAYIRNKPSLGAASLKDVDGSIASDSASTNLPTSQAVADLISREIGAVDAMRFKGTVGTGGTVTNLPTSGVKVGDTYRVITAGTYSGHACEIGDLIIATATTPAWAVAQTNITGITKTPGTFVTGGTKTSITPVTAKTVVTGVTKKTVVTGGTTTNITPVTKKTVVTGVTPATVVTSASGATASYSSGVLTITNGSFGTGASATVTTGDSVTTGTAVAAYTGLTTGDSVTVTTGDSVTAGTAVQAYTSLTTGNALTDVSFTTD